MLKKDVPFTFGVDQERAFQELKNALINDPVLHLLKYGAYTEMHTDASKHGLAAVLLQQGDEASELHPVQYMSRKTSEPEQKYHSYELEAMAVVQAFKKWRPYLLDKSRALGYVPSRF